MKLLCSVLSIMIALGSLSGCATSGTSNHPYEQTNTLRNQGNLPNQAGNGSNAGANTAARMISPVT